MDKVRNPREYEPLMLSALHKGMQDTLAKAVHFLDQRQYAEADKVIGDLTEMLHELRRRSVTGRWGEAENCMKKLNEAFDRIEARESVGDPEWIAWRAAMDRLHERIIARSRS